MVFCGRNHKIFPKYSIKKVGMTWNYTRQITIFDT